MIGEDVSDSIQVGLYYAEAVYAPLYYGYGRDAFSDRRRRAREWDRALLEIAPETVLVLLRASPEGDTEADARGPAGPDGVPREEDVERVIDLFEEQYAATELKHKLAIRTSGVTVAESVAEFAGKGLAVPHRRGPPAEGVGAGTSTTLCQRGSVFQPLAARSHSRSG